MKRCLPQPATGRKIQIHTHIWEHRENSPVSLRYFLPPSRYLISTNVGRYSKRSEVYARSPEFIMAASYFNESHARCIQIIKKSETNNCSAIIEFILCTKQYDQPSTTYVVHLKLFHKGSCACRQNRNRSGVRQHKIGCLFINPVQCTV